MQLLGGFEQMLSEYPIKPFCLDLWPYQVSLHLACFYFSLANTLINIVLSTIIMINAGSHPL